MIDIVYGKVKTGSTLCILQYDMYAPGVHKASELGNIMVSILDGCSFHYAHTWSKSDMSIYWRHVVTSKESSNSIFFEKSPCLHHTCATWNEQPSNIKTMVTTLFFSSLHHTSRLLHFLASVCRTQHLWTFSFLSNCWYHSFFPAY